MFVIPSVSDISQRCLFLDLWLAMHLHQHFRQYGFRKLNARGLYHATDSCETHFSCAQVRLYPVGRSPHPSEKWQNSKTIILKPFISSIPASNTHTAC